MDITAITWLYAIFKAKSKVPEQNKLNNSYNPNELLT